MKNNKVQLEELKVDSFITSMEDENQVEVKGGTNVGCAAASVVISLATITAYSVYTAYTNGRDASAWDCEEEPYQG